jgi:hypothetical protein
MGDGPWGDDMGEDVYFSIFCLLITNFLTYVLHQSCHITLQEKVGGEKGRLTLGSARAFIKRPSSHDSASDQLPDKYSIASFSSPLSVSLI